MQDYNIYLSVGGEYFNLGLDDYYYLLAHEVYYNNLSTHANG